MTVAKNDLIVGVVLVALAILYWLGADAIPKSILAGGVGADALPKMLGVALGILSLVLVIQSLLSTRSPRAEADGTKAGKIARAVHRYALGMLCIGIGYILLVELVGYACAIAYLLAAVTLLTGGATRKAIIVFSVGGAVFFWVLFVFALEIRQPAGFWPHLWKSFHSAPAQTQSQLQISTPQEAS